jgi:hypothetical protein
LPRLEDFVLFFGIHSDWSKNLDSTRNSSPACYFTLTARAIVGVAKSC